MGEFIPYFTLREVFIILIVIGYIKSSKRVIKRKGKKKPKRKSTKK